MTTDKPDLVELREAAEKATPGPWKPCGANDDRCQCRQVWSEPADIPIVYTLRDSDENWTGGDGATEEQAKDNATFIAAADPTTVLTLIARVEAAEAEVKRQYELRLEGAEDYLADLATAAELIEELVEALKRADMKNVRLRVYEIFRDAPNGETKRALSTLLLVIDDAEPAGTWNKALAAYDAWKKGRNNEN